MKQAFRMILALIVIGSLMAQACAPASKQKSLPAKPQKVIDSMRDEAPSFRWHGVEELIKERKAGDAVYRASVLLVDYPNDALGYMLRGRAYALQEEFDLALTDFSKAIQLSPENPEGFARRGYVYFQYKKEYRPAFDDTDRAIEKGMQVLKWDMRQGKGQWTVNLYNLRAVLYHEFDQLELALQDINTAIAMASRQKHKGGLSFYLLRRAFIHQSMQQLDAAADDARQALGLYPCLAGAYRVLGNVALSQGNFSQSVTYYDKAIGCLAEKKGLGFADAQTGKAVARWIMGQKAQAWDDMKASLQQTALEPHVYFAMGYMAHEDGDKNLARTYFSRAQELMPDIFAKKKKQPDNVENERVKSFYRDRLRVAGYYYGSSPKPDETVSRPPGTTLTINRLSVVPNPVTKNAPFDIETSYFLSDPSASGNDLSLMYRFEIHQGARKLFESRSIPIRGQNAQESVWVQHMNPVSMTGRFRVITHLEYMKETVQAESAFQIQ